MKIADQPRPCKRKPGVPCHARDIFWCGADSMKARDIVLGTRITEKDTETTDDCGSVRATR